MHHLLAVLLPLLAVAVAPNAEKGLLLNSATPITPALVLPHLRLSTKTDDTAAPDPAIAMLQQSLQSCAKSRPNEKALEVASLIASQVTTRWFTHDNQSLSGPFNESVSFVIAAVRNASGIPTGERNARSLAEQFVAIERGNVVRSLQNAVAECKETRLPVPQPVPGRMSWGRDGYLHGTDGKPRFVSGYYSYGGVEVPTSHERLLGRDAVNLFIRPAELMPEPTMKISNRSLVELLRAVDRMSQANVSLLLLRVCQDPRGGGGVPSWAIKQAPEMLCGRHVKNCTEHSINYDIDHPLARAIFAKILGAIVPAIIAQINRRVPFAFDLSGEPQFTNTSSNFTFQRYRSWLAQRYNYSVPELAASWKLPLRSFNDVDTVPLSPLDANTTLTHWIDWNVFNNERVLGWLSWLRSQVRNSSGSNARVLAYPAGPLLWGIYTKRPVQQWGLDWVGIARALDVLGTDTRVQPGPCNGVRTGTKGGCNVIFPQHNSTLPSMSMVATYDFLRSVAPHKVLIDPEWHAISSETDPFQTGFSSAVNTSRAYLRNAMWRAHLHGVSAQFLWYWGRANMTGIFDPHGSASRSAMFYGSLGTQPQLLDTHVRTQLQLRTFASDIAAVVNRPAEVLLLFSSVCAIADLRHLQLLLSVYEALYSLDIQVRFLPDSDLCNEQHPVALQHARHLIIPSNSLAADCTMDKLQALATSHLLPKLLVFGTADDVGNLFRLTERGQRRSKATLTWLSALPTVILPPGNDSIGPALTHTFERALDLDVKLGRTRCFDAASSAHPTFFGVFCKSAGSRLFLVNLHNTTIHVGVDGWLQAGQTARDAWRLSVVDAASLELAPYEVSILDKSKSRGEHRGDAQINLTGA